MRRAFAVAIVGFALSAATPSTVVAADDGGAGGSPATAALRFTEWTMVHTMGTMKGTDPSVTLRIADQPEKPMMLMSCVDRPYGSYKHICAMFARCADVPKESWRATIGEPLPGTLLVAACAEPLHFFVVRRDGDRIVALRRKMRRVKATAPDEAGADGGAPGFGDPFCRTCASTPTEDWRESRSMPLDAGTTVMAMPAERRAATWDLD